MSLKAFGFEIIEGKLNAISEDIHGKIINPPLLKALVEGERMAKTLCPVDTGRLRASIAWEQIQPNIVFLGTDVEYAEFIEYGTINMSPRPYIRPAAVAVEKMAQEGIKVQIINTWEAS